MARKRRDDFCGAWHHVMHRGARRQPIFAEDADCAYFLGLLHDVVKRFGIEVHGFALMPNHYHLLVRSVHGNLSRSIGRLNQLYTQYLNRKYDWDGPVFRGRFRSELVSEEWQLPYVLAYIHLNPLKANLVTKLDGDWWTSHSTYMGSTTYSEWLTTDYFEGIFDSPSKLQNYILDLHRGAADWPEAMSLTSGLLQLQDSGARLVDEPKRSHWGADEVLSRVCALTGADGEQIRTVVSGPGANPARRFAVWALGNHTTLTHKEIGSTLQMSTKQVANVLRDLRRRVPEKIRVWRSRWTEEIER